MVIPRFRTHGIAMVVLFNLSACATKQESDEKAVVTPIYRLSATTPVQHKAPLPTESIILVHWKVGEHESTYNGFKAWDFDHDGNFEMLEILASDGKITGRAYDFDGDGKIDVRQAVIKESSLPQKLSEVSGQFINENFKTPSFEDAMETLRVAH